MFFDQYYVRLHYWIALLYMDSMHSGRIRALNILVHKMLFLPQDILLKFHSVHRSFTSLTRVKGIVHTKMKIL